MKWNEYVDKRAKEAVSRTSIDFVFKKRSVLKRLIDNQKLKEWQTRWDTSDKGRCVYDLFPDVKKNRLITNFYLNQIITQHGFLGTYQYRFFNKNQTCICNKDISDVNHVIFRCDLVDDIRQKYFPLNYTNVSLYKLLHSCKSRSGIIEIVRYFCNIIFEDLNRL